MIDSVMVTVFVNIETVPFIDLMQCSSCSPSGAVGRRLVLDCCPGESQEDVVTAGRCNRFRLRLTGHSRRVVSDCICL